ncbi:hypothetical protein B0I35DRAFT_437209 [Stachybotrys elegans]|uniref:G domain-containing protein n=1 Tax=Stachybotrys elegans TaxID=80388 RepID=A0A8K0SL06_9HYPO|nr:hypothetical protein B0I35DRAFT_437209 [Stachybotrys elegans]
MAADLREHVWGDAGTSLMNTPEGRLPRPTDVYIAVMGVTGSGKSSFIAQCSGKPVRIGHDLNACTSTVGVYEYDMSPQRRVYLIDTPGFDDTLRSDAEVLKEIATWLGESYKKKILLNGIIYLHRITDRRMQGSARRNLILFKQLCGQNCLKKVVLVTTMWDQVHDDTGEMRESELKKTRDFWGWMVEEGSSVYRHDHTKDSATRIIHTLAEHNEPIVTDLQRELVDEHRRLNDTSAGRGMQSELVRQKKKLVDEYDDMGKKLEIAKREHDVAVEEMLQEERALARGEIERMDQAISSLRLNFEKLVADRDERYTSWKDQLEEIRQRTERLEVEQGQVEERRGERNSVATLVSPVSSAASTHEEARTFPGTGSIIPDKMPQQPMIAYQALRMPQDSRIASVSLWGDVVCIIGDCSINSYEYPKLKFTSGPKTDYLRQVSFGETVDGSKSWIARYDQNWMKSDNLEIVYPELAQGIRQRDIQTLQCCFLGPDRQYFARWEDGCARYLSQTNFSRYLEGRNHIVDVSFGFDRTCFLVYVAPGNKHNYYYELKSHYQDLSYFLTLRENRKIIILGITLDPGSTTDYILVYTYSKLLSSKERKIRYCCSEANSSLMSNFWYKS